MQYIIRTLALSSCLVLSFVAAGCWPGCWPGSSSPDAADVEGLEGEQPAMVVSSSYLAAAVHEVMGEGEPVMVLAEPGMCPGHFDLRPSQVRRLRASRLLVRFHFQRSLDARIGVSEGVGPRIVSVTVTGGMCEPASYLDACRQVAEALVEQERLSAAAAEERLAAVAERMDLLAEWSAGELQRGALQDQPVLCSGHQAAFCRWLGLRVVATFSAGDTAPPSEIDQAIKAGEADGVSLIVANRPEGRQMADALADRLNARVVVFGNFPESNKPGAFEELVRYNVTSLIEVMQP
jgi:zinc transport system substrate-binding protein